MQNETTQTKILTALLGDPVEHSLSPRMHQCAYDLLGLHYVYHAYRVTPSELAEVQNELIARGARGWNLTMPLKTMAVDMMDALDASALRAGSVNTVVVENGRKIGHNTDGIGMMKALAHAGVTVKEKRVVLLGAGGAASAILAEAAVQGAAEICVYVRHTSAHLERIHALSRALETETDCMITQITENSLQEHTRHADILINATPVGMAPETDCSLIPDASYIAPGMAVADAIYHPNKTKLLKIAEQAGCTIIPGLEMLLHQGAEAFHLWTNHEMPLEAVRHALPF